MHSGSGIGAQGAKYVSMKVDMYTVETVFGSGLSQMGSFEMTSDFTCFPKIEKLQVVHGLVRYVPLGTVDSENGYSSELRNSIECVLRWTIVLLIRSAVLAPKLCTICM